MSGLYSRLDMCHDAFKASGIGTIVWVIFGHALVLDSIACVQSQE